MDNCGLNSDPANSERRDSEVAALASALPDSLENGPYDNVVVGLAHTRILCFALSTMQEWLQQLFQRSPAGSYSQNPTSNHMTL